MIDAAHLAFSNKNLFNATEISTLVPTYGGEIYKKLLAQNAWINDYFPNFIEKNTAKISDKNSWAKSILEMLNENRFGEKIDVFLMKKTEKSWRQKNDKSLFENPDENLNIQRHIAKAHNTKNHPKIVKNFQQKISDFELKFGIKLTMKN